MRTYQQVRNNSWQQQQQLCCYSPEHCILMNLFKSQHQQCTKSLLCSMYAVQVYGQVLEVMPA
jgi:hypothetical protein